MTKQEIQAERERFEHWSKKGDGPHLDTRRYRPLGGKLGPRYKDLYTEHAWIGWLGRAMIDR